MATPFQTAHPHAPGPPDPSRIEQCRRLPRQGPRILFFSGGSALKRLSRTLKRYTHNSIHFVTPFDSGGSSAELRQAFAMPSVGDLRSRLMSLADESLGGQPDVYRLFRHRFPEHLPQRALGRQLDALARGSDPLVRDIPDPMQRVIRGQLAAFRGRMPAGFDLRGASIGNLVLAGGYLSSGQELGPVIARFSRMARVLGTVRTIVDDDLHLVADLRDGRRILGQHRLTGKQTTPIDSPVQHLHLSHGLGHYRPAGARLGAENRRLIERADLICYPPGSFYSSLLANLLPRGVGRAVAAAACPKLYIPNLERDPEQIGMDLQQGIERLLELLRRDAGEDCPTERLLNSILIDSGPGRYPSPPPRDYLQAQGIRLIEMPLISRRSHPWYDPELLTAALISLSRPQPLSGAGGPVRQENSN